MRDHERGDEMSKCETDPGEHEQSALWMMEVPHRSRLQAALELAPFETAPCDPFEKANETPFPSSR